MRGKGVLPKVYFLHIALPCFLLKTGILEKRHQALFFMVKLIAKLPLGFSESGDGRVVVRG